MAQGTTKALPLDSDATLAGNSNLVAPTQRAIRSYITNAISSLSVPDIAQITATFDGGGSAITAGTKVSVQVKFNCFIASWTILSADGTSGSIQIDINKSTYAGFPTTASITNANEPDISVSTKGTGDVTGWTTAQIDADDIIEFEVDSVTSIQHAIITLELAY